jgi:predicted dehydrogenase
MMKKKFKVAIIGAGYMAEEYLKVFSAKKIPCEAIYSRTASKSKNLKKKYKIKRIYTSLDDLKNDNQINALIIAVNLESTKNLINSLDINKYRVLCEKPVGINFKETKKIISKIKSKYFYVGLNRRFYSSNLKAYNLINKNKSKRLISIRDQELQNNTSDLYNKNLMYGNSVHLIDYINVYARGKLLKVQRLKKFKNYKFSENLTRLIFSSKDEVLYHCNWNSPGPWSVNIIQKDHSVEMKPLENLVQEKLIDGKRIRVFHNKSKNDTKFKPGLFNQVSAFLKMLNNKQHKLISLNDYFNTVKLIKKIYV